MEKQVFRFVMPLHLWGFLFPIIEPLVCVSLIGRETNAAKNFHYTPPAIMYLTTEAIAFG